MTLADQWLSRIGWHQPPQTYGQHCDPSMQDNKGVHPRFINRPLENFDNLIAEEIESSMAFGPGGGARIGARIGTHMRKKILKPFIYDVLDSGDKLGRPYLIFRSRMEAIKVKQRIDYEMRSKIAAGS